MKKILAAILFANCLFSLIGCFTPKTKEYNGTPLKSLSFETIDYMGGHKHIYVFDFEENIAKSRDYSPYGEENSEFKIIAAFSQEEETELINKLYSRGLFNIKNNYPTPQGIMDGGGWNLVIKYADGTKKESSGSNNSPTLVFKNCATAFYDICEEGVVASVPQEYYCPPNLSYALRVQNGSYGYSSFTKRLNYKWNGFEEQGCNAYEENLAFNLPHELHANEEYSLIIYTANYNNYNKYERFAKCTVKTYGFDEDMTNETEVYSSGWFDQIEIPLEFNKIYVLRLDFKNGDFVEHTFNTKLP